MSIADQVSYDAIGTAAAKAALTSSYTTTPKALYARYLQNINILGSYLPLTDNATLQLLVEMSPDGTNWAPLPVVNNTATVIQDYTENVPITIPGDSTSTASTAVPISYQFSCASQWVRVSAKETGGTTPGSAWVSVTLANTP